MVREIVMDTETTGVNPNNGDRIVEIGCVELINHLPTGKTFHVYLNPERSMPQEAFKIHGLSDEFLADKPLFADVADDFLNFIQEDKLVIHNASFDIGFLNAELKRINAEILPSDRALDTLQMARRKHPGAQNSLDALCSRYGIDNSMREQHGALLDSYILAEVYLELIGGRQTGFDLSLEMSHSDQNSEDKEYSSDIPVRNRAFTPLLKKDEYEAHEAFVETLGKKAIWHDYIRHADHDQE